MLFGQVLAGASSDSFILCLVFDRWWRVECNVDKLTDVGSKKSIGGYLPVPLRTLPQDAISVYSRERLMSLPANFVENHNRSLILPFFKTSVHKIP